MDKNNPNPVITITYSAGLRGECPHYPGYTGRLSDAPVTALVPEGIESSRTIEEAGRVRELIGLALVSHDAVALQAIGWTLRASLVDGELPS